MLGNYRRRQQTDRRSLNRAKPPPIFLQREEEVTPGVWPRAHAKAGLVRPVNAPSAAAIPAKLPPAAKPVAALEAAKGSTSVSASRSDRRVVSEDVAPIFRRDARAYADDGAAAATAQVFHLLTPTTKIDT